MAKRALIVGINDYTQQQSLPAGWSVGNLSCCVADANSMNDLLLNAFGFDEVTSLLTDGAASRDAILGALQRLLSNSRPGDVVCFSYSGHGGRLPADPQVTNRYYECIVPASGAPITDMDIFNLANTLDQSVVNFTLFLDSCNSGGIHEGAPDSTVRSVAYTPDFVQTCVAEMNTVIPCGVTLPPGGSSMDGNVGNVIGQGNGIVCSIDDNKSLVPLSKSTVVAACRYDEEALELNGHGVLTQGLLDLIKQSNLSVTYLKLIDQLRNDLQRDSTATQTPTLLGQQSRVSEEFLAPWTTSS